MEVNRETGEGRVIRQRERDGCEREKRKEKRSGVVGLQAAGTVQENVKMDASASTSGQSGGGATTLVVIVDEDTKPVITRLEAQRTRLRYHEMRQSAVPDACNGV